MSQLSRTGCGAATPFAGSKLPWILISYDSGAIPSGADFQAFPWNHTPPSQSFYIYDPDANGNMPAPPTNPGNVFPHFFYDTATDILTIKQSGIYWSNLVIDWQAVPALVVGGVLVGNNFNRMCAIGPPTGPIAPSWANFASPDLYLPPGNFQTVLRSYTWLSKTVDSGPLVMDSNHFSPPYQWKAFYYQDRGLTFPAFTVQASWTVVCLSGPQLDGYHDA